MSSVKDVSKDKLICHAVPQSLGLSDRHGNSSNQSCHCQKLTMTSLFVLIVLPMLLLFLLVLLLYLCATLLVLLHCDNCDFYVFVLCFCCCGSCELWFVLVFFTCTPFSLSQKTKREWSSSNKNKANKANMQTSKKQTRKQETGELVASLHFFASCENESECSENDGSLF